MCGTPRDCAGAASSGKFAAAGGLVLLAAATLAFAAQPADE